LADAAEEYSTQAYFYEWRAIGLLGRINHSRVMVARELEGRQPSLSAGDRQDIKITEHGARKCGSAGHDAGKK
jgi:hypothetical protein